MNPINDRETGRLLEAVERMEIDIRSMKDDIESLKLNLARGKGVVAGLFLAAAGVGAAVKGLLDKVGSP